MVWFIEWVDRLGLKIIKDRQLVEISGNETVVKLVNSDNVIVKFAIYFDYTNNNT